uniref:NADH:ubiquinone oxidoreductase-like 20kDa subunit domain-containing protein n=1 Tax=candidate division WOR-3 bacterium TaxID=2052148 RepID=A0A7C3J6W7_UNCW3
MLYDKVNLRYIIFGSGCCIDTFFSLDSEYYRSEKIILERTESYEEADIIILYGCFSQSSFQFIEDEIFKKSKKKIYVGNFTFLDESMKDEIVKNVDRLILGCPVDCKSLIEFLEGEFYDRE